MKTLFFILLLVPYSFSFGDTHNFPQMSLTLGVYKGIEKIYPHLLPTLKKAAAGQNINIQYKLNLPPSRSLISAANGNIGGDILRQPFAVEGLPSLIQVGVPIQRIKYWIWVLKTRSCPASEAQLSQLKPVGLLGLKFFDLIYRQSKVGFEQVNSIKALANMLKLERADFSMGQKESVAYISALTGIAFKTCFPRPFISLDGFMYLNKKHQALVPLLEQAFKTLVLDE